MTKEIQKFNFEGNGVTMIIDEKGEPWFVAADVCRILDLHTERAVSRLDDDEKTSVRLTHEMGTPKKVVISEPGLYKLIARLRKPEVKKFDRWVRYDVLPTIRKIDVYEYETPQNLDELGDFVLQLFENLGRKIKALDSQLNSRLDDIEDMVFQQINEQILDSIEEQGGLDDMWNVLQNVKKELHEEIGFNEDEKSVH